MLAKLTKQRQNIVGFLSGNKGHQVILLLHLLYPYTLHASLLCLTSHIASSFSILYSILHMFVCFGMWCVLL